MVIEKAPLHKESFFVAKKDSPAYAEEPSIHQSNSEFSIPNSEFTY